MPDPRIHVHVERLSEFTVEDFPLEPMEFMLMLLDIHDEASAISEAMRGDRSIASTQVRYAAEMVRLFADDSMRAFSVSLELGGADRSAANDAAGKAVTFARSVRDIYRHRYP